MALINRITDRYVSFERPLAAAPTSETVAEILAAVGRAMGARFAARKAGGRWVVERDGVVVTDRRRKFAYALNDATGLDVVVPRTR